MFTNMSVWMLATLTASPTMATRSFWERRTNQKQIAMKVRFKKLHPNAVVPTYAHPTDAGIDLTAVSKRYDENGNIVYGTGIAVEIPHGYVGLVFPRSSIAKKDLSLTNSVGVIDSGYRGEITFIFFRTNYPWLEYNVGDRIGQLIIMPYPHIELEEADKLSASDRGDGSYGSTGR